MKGSFKMRINNVMRNRIQNVVNAKRHMAIEEARKDIIAKQKEFEEKRQRILDETNAKLWELVNEYDARLPYRNEKPREASSICGLETPISIKTPATRSIFLSASSSRMWEKGA